MSEKQIGFFEMKDVSQVLKCNSLEEAKNYLSSCIKNFVNAHPKTEYKNIIKANHMINKANSPEKLSLSVSNFILAHPSENLKVIR